MVLTQTEKIVLICAAIFWQIFSIIIFIVVNKNTSKEYRKFYPHPIVGLAKDIQHDGRFNVFEILLIRTILTIVYLPITIEWLVGWCLYKFWKFIYIDDTQEGLAQKEMSEFKETNEEYIKNAKQIMEEGLENPEYINKIEKNDQSRQSDEFFKYMRLQNAQSDLDSQTYKNAQADISNLNNIDNMKNIQTPLMYECPILMEDNKEQKPKRKYTKKKKTNDEVENETKDN